MRRPRLLFSGHKPLCDKQARTRSLLSEHQSSPLWILVDLKRLELSTSRMRTERSPSWATGPCEVIDEIDSATFWLRCQNWSASIWKKSLAGFAWNRTRLVDNSPSQLNYELLLLRGIPGLLSIPVWLLIDSIAQSFSFVKSYLSWIKEINFVGKYPVIAVADRKDAFQRPPPVIISKQKLQNSKLGFRTIWILRIFILKIDFRVE